MVFPFDVYWLIYFDEKIVFALKFIYHNGVVDLHRLRWPDSANWQVIQNPKL